MTDERLWQQRLPGLPCSAIRSTSDLRDYLHIVRGLEHHQKEQRESDNDSSDAESSWWEDLWGDWFMPKNLAAAALQTCLAPKSATLDVQYECLGDVMTPAAELRDEVESLKADCATLQSDLAHMKGQRENQVPLHQKRDRERLPLAQL